MNRTLAQVMLEGQEKTLEAMTLKAKQVAGTLTADESTRLAMLEGNLLALAGEAQGLGLDTNAILEASRARVAAETAEALGEDYDELEDEDVLELDEYNPFADEDEDEDILGLDDEDEICACRDPECGSIY